MRKSTGLLMTVSVGRAPAFLEVLLEPGVAVVDVEGGTTPSVTTLVRKRPGGGPGDAAAEDERDLGGSSPVP